MLFSVGKNMNQGKKSIERGKPDKGASKQASVKKLNAIVVGLKSKSASDQALNPEGVRKLRYNGIILSPLLSTVIDQLKFVRTTIDFKSIGATV